jgi:hypothetical protein
VAAVALLLQQARLQQAGLAVVVMDKQLVLRQPLELQTEVAVVVVLLAVGRVERVRLAVLALLSSPTLAHQYLLVEQLHPLAATQSTPLHRLVRW